MDMKETETVMYSGQGYIYRCPECFKVDRTGYEGEIHCRFCHKPIKLVEVHQMTEGLYSVIREINFLETGTVFGMSPQMLKDSVIGRSAKSVGLDILQLLDIKRVNPENKQFMDSLDTELNKILDKAK